MRWEIKPAGKLYTYSCTGCGENNCSHEFGGGNIPYSRRTGDSFKCWHCGRLNTITDKTEWDMHENMFAVRLNLFSHHDFPEPTEWAHGKTIEEAKKILEAFYC